MPLPIDLLSTSLQLIECSERNSEMSRLDRLKTGRNRLINAIATHGLTGLLGQLRVGLPAFVAGNTAISQVADVHATAAGSTQHDPLQEGCSFTYSPASLLWPPRAIVIQDLLIGSELGPR